MICSMCTASCAGDFATPVGKLCPSFQEKRLILSATHIHTGPNTSLNVFLQLLDNQQDDPRALSTDSCRAQVAAGIVKAISQAIESLEESRFEVGALPCRPACPAHAARTAARRCMGTCIGKISAAWKAAMAAPCKCCIAAGWGSRKAHGDRGQTSPAPRSAMRWLCM